MGAALLAGLLEAQWAQPGQLAVVEADPGRRHELVERFPGVAVLAEVGPASGAVVAVKPADAVAVCAALSANGVPRVVSVAAGVPVARLEEAFTQPVAVIRAMPNTPAQVGVGASAIAAGTHVDEGDLRWAESILSAVGITVRVDEHLIDAVTGLSGSGPAYVFAMVESLIAAGVAEGLAPEVAGALVVQTVAGAARILQESGANGRDAGEHRAAVTSPNGTTAAGLAAMEALGFSGAVSAAVAAAAQRSRELGGSGGSR
jgi:pyrroline-5-carboxylate reductase